MQNLMGKRILLIALTEYAQGLIDQMTSMGAKVDYISDKPNNRVICKTLGRLKFKPYMFVFDNYYSKKIKEYAANQYDYILSIRGEYTPVKALLQLKQHFPNAEMILYMWDSIRNNEGINSKWKYYDKVYTFDRIDYLAHKNEIYFLPLFYFNKYLPKSKSEYKYDVAFIGTGHGDRMYIINQVKKQCDKEGIKYFVFAFLPHKLIYLKNKLFNKKYKEIKISDVSFNLLPTKKAYEIYNSSKCVIDIESPTQNGLTMRTIEMIGLKKKLITTNKDIVNYDFYNPNNILVCDRENFKIDRSFIESPYMELSKEVYDKYSLQGWLLHIFGGDSK